jgi:hypothetical protein
MWTASYRRPVSSKRAQRRKACGTKRRFDTQDEALAMIRAIRAAGRGGGLVPYHCPHCGHYHVGHPPANIRQGIQAQRLK